MKVTRAINSPIDIQLADIPVSPFINNYSLSFDGIDDIVRLGTPSTVGTGGINTLSFWVKANAQSTAGITDYLFSDDGGSGYNWWRFFHGHGTNLYWRNINGVAFNLAPNLFDGNWHNVVVIRNPSDLVNGSLRIYVDNGTPLDRTLDWRYGVAGLYNGALGTIGNNNTASSGFNGIIDEVSVWNSEITSSDVASIYNSGTPTDLSLLPTPPLNWYRNGDNGVYKSPQWLIPNNENKDKVSNYSFEFDGIDDRVQLSSDFVASGEFTLSFWMKPVAVTGNGNIFPIGTFPDNQNHVRLDQIGVIYLKVQAVLCLFNEGVVGGGANNLVLDVWQHMTFIRDSSNVITCYRNGSTFGGTATNSGTLTLNSFGRVIANTFGFGGGLDGIAFWNSDQTSNLATIYNSGTPTTLPSGAVAHYKMGEDATFSGGVWTVPDSVGSNDGTSVNMTIEDRVGNAPNSTSNAVSLNMDEVDRATDVPT